MNYEAVTSLCSSLHESVIESDIGDEDQSMSENGGSEWANCPGLRWSTIEDVVVTGVVSVFTGDNDGLT